MSARPRAVINKNIDPAKVTVRSCMVVSLPAAVRSHLRDTVAGKISSAVMASTGIDSSDSKEVSHLGQSHK